MKLDFSMTWLMEILMTYLEDLLADKVLRNKAFNIARNPKCDRYQRGRASMVYTFFNKKAALLPQSETLATQDKSASNTNKRTGILILVQFLKTKN